MASFADKNGVLYNFASQAPSPSKDFCQIVVTLDKVYSNLKCYISCFECYVLSCNIHFYVVRAALCISSCHVP